MKITKLVLLIAALIFVALGLLKILPYSIVTPILFFCLATMYALRSAEFKQKGDKVGFVAGVIGAIIFYVILIVDIFIW